MGLTSPGCQAAVLWTEPPDDATKENEIRGNKWGGRDDKGHCSVITFNKEKKGNSCNSLTVRYTPSRSRDFDSTTIDRSSQQARGSHRKLHSEKATRDGNETLVKYGRLSRITTVSSDPFD